MEKAVLMKYIQCLNCITLVLFFVMSLSPCTAQEKPATETRKKKPLSIETWPEKREAKDSKPRKFYLDRRIAPTMSFRGGASWLVRPERETEESSREMLENLGLKPGMIVADFGCGVGYHTIPIAKAVGPEGQVYGIDIQPEMLRALVANAKEDGITNIVPIQPRGNVAEIPENTFDMLLMVDVYHELALPAETLSEIRESLKPEGLVALVEFRGEDPDVPILPEHKMTKAQILKEYEANGFELHSAYDNLPWQHLMFFKVKKD